MTGTADTEAEEFNQIYELDVVVIPTNQPMIRKDTSDMIYASLPEKWDAVSRRSQELHGRASPCSSAPSRSRSPSLSRTTQGRSAFRTRFSTPSITRQEAEIIAQAGRKGAVTIATNMAGRGTDILLGGNPEALARDYLKRMEINPDEASPEQFEEQLRKAKAVVAEEHMDVPPSAACTSLGTERHESRRIDNQLRGRPDARATPVRRDSTVARGRPDAYLRRRLRSAR